MTDWHESRRSPVAHSPFIGTRRRGGYLKRCASMLTKGLGTRTPATATTVGFSSFSARPVVWGSRRGRILRARVNRYSGHGLSIDVTATRGVSGAPPPRADYGKLGG